MTEKKKQNRRTPEQIVADLESKIARVKEREVARAARASEEGKAIVAALKAVDKALRVAKAAGDEAMEKALDAARAPLAAHLAERGVELRTPGARKRGRRGATEAA